jgi:hypothetical protein
LTAGPEVGISQAVQKVYFEAQILMSNLGKATIRVQQAVSVQLFGKPKALCHLIIHTNSRSSNLAKHIVLFRVT